MVHIEGTYAVVKGHNFVEFLIHLGNILNDRSPITVCRILTTYMMIN